MKPNRCAPEGYRLLQQGTIIEEDDLFLSATSVWKKAITTIGHPVRYVPYCRKEKQPKNTEESSIRSEEIKQPEKKPQGWGDW